MILLRLTEGPSWNQAIAYPLKRWIRDGEVMVVWRNDEHYEWRFFWRDADDANAGTRIRRLG